MVRWKYFEIFEKSRRLQNQKYKQVLKNWLKILKYFVHSLKFINVDAIKDETNPGAKSDILRLEVTFSLYMNKRNPFLFWCFLPDHLSVWRNIPGHRLGLCETIPQPAEAELRDPRVRGLQQPVQLRVRAGQALGPPQVLAGDAAEELGHARLQGQGRAGQDGAHLPYIHVCEFLILICFSSLCNVYISLQRSTTMTPI